MSSYMQSGEKSIHLRKLRKTDKMTKPNKIKIETLEQLGQVVNDTQEMKYKKNPKRLRPDIKL